MRWRCPGRRPATLALVLWASLALSAQACGGDGGQPEAADAGAVDVLGDTGTVDVLGDTGTVDAAADGGPPAQELLVEVTLYGVGGHVVSSPPGIDCPATCGAPFAQGTTVTLTVRVDSAYWFGGWGDACDGRNANCTLTMTEPRAVSAVFFLVNPPWDSTVGAGDCQSVWADQAAKISACDSVPDDYVVVRKSARNLALCQSGALVQNYRAGLGFDPVGDKEQQGDGRTPEGVFYVTVSNPTSDFYKSLDVSYPDKEDAARGLAAGLITAAEQAAIDAAQDACAESPASTGLLGGDIEIHGNHTQGDWTYGCVAISDAGMDAVFAALGVGDTVVILP